MAGPFVIPAQELDARAPCDAGTREEAEGGEGHAGQAGGPTGRDVCPSGTEGKGRAVQEAV
eukprot:scaffold170983_cov41-Prasinocladus_malaysianus.AAC.1